MSDSLPAGWSKPRLSDIAELQLGKMLDRANNVTGQSMPYLRNVNIRWGLIETSDLYSMRFTASEAARFSVRDGDVLVCEGGEPGRCAIWRGGSTDLKFQKAIHRIRPGTRLLPEWITLFLRHEAQHDRLADHFTGTTIKHLPAQALAALRLPVPPLAEQRRIVGRVEDLFTRTRRARADLERIAPLSAAYRRSALEQAFSADVAEGNIVPLGSLLTAIEAGKNMRCDERQPHPGENGIVKISAVTWGRFDPTAIKTAPNDVVLDPRSRIANGDFLMSRANRGRLRIRVKSGHKPCSNGSGCGLSGSGVVSMSSV